MLINNDYKSSFLQRIDHPSSREELKATLQEGRNIRLQSGKNTHFWDFHQRRIHQAFDVIYARGIEKLATTTSGEQLSLTGRSIPKMPLPAMAKTAARAAAIGLSGFAGWLVGFIYDQSMSNDILHEYGHYLALYLLEKDPHAFVSTNAQYWLQHHEWWKWFWGERDGGPGNWTSGGSFVLTDIGKWFTQQERDLIVVSGGLGIELIANTFIAGLGLLALRKKQRALGASLLGFSVVAHSAAFSYINRNKDLLDHKMPNPWPGGDPPTITADLARLLGWTTQEAYHLLYYGYFFSPFVLLGFLTALGLKSVNEIPDECVLMRLLTENSSMDLKKLIAELEVEMGPECDRIEELSKGKQQEFTWKISDRLITRIKDNPKTRSLFESTRTQIAKECKGKFNVTTSFAFRLRIIASLVAFVAYQLLTIGKTLLPMLAKAFYYLVGTYIGLQSLCLAIDAVQTGIDLSDKKLSALAKGISVSRTALSLISLVMISLSLLVPGLNFLTIPILIATALIRLLLFVAHLYEMRQHAKQQVKPGEPKLVSNDLAEQAC